MNFNKALKVKILSLLQEQLDTKIREARLAVAAATDSRNSDTKSSAGDKHETGRAMMQMEIDTVELQLHKARQQQQDLSKIDADREYTKVVPGSLVITGQGNYFISIGLGKIMVDGHTFYAISLAAPVGLLLKDKTAGDHVRFGNRVVEIRQII